MRIQYISLSVLPSALENKEATAHKLPVIEDGDRKRRRRRRKKKSDPVNRVDRPRCNPISFQMFTRSVPMSFPLVSLSLTHDLLPSAIFRAVSVVHALQEFGNNLSLLFFFPPIAFVNSFAARFFSPSPVLIRFTVLDRSFTNDD